jgi:chromosome segregation ATPase
MNVVDQQQQQQSQCQGMVKENGTLRPCKKTGKAVYANGYCTSHQYIAVGKIREQLELAQQEVTKLKKTGSYDNKTARTIQLLEQQIIMLRDELKDTERICSGDDDCSNHLRDILVTMHDLNYPLAGKGVKSETNSDALSRLKKIEAQMNQLAVGTSPEDAKAFMTSQEYELARRRQGQVNHDIQMYQAELQERSAEAEGQERKFQQVLQTLTQNLKQNQSQKVQADQIVESLQKRIDRCQAESRQVAGVYSETINNLKDEVQKYKDLYNNMVGREMRYGKSVDSLTQNERKLEQALAELKQSYETKMAKLQDEFAQQIKSGGTVLSQREEQLQEEVKRLQADLELAVTDLKLATEAGKEAINRAVNVDRPYGQLAKELMQVNDMLKAKNQEVAELQALHDKRMAEFAEAEMQTANKIDEASAKDRAEIQRLSLELSKSEKKLSTTHQEIVALQTTAYELRRQHQNEVNRLNNQLRDTQNRLLQMQNHRTVEKQALQQKFQAMLSQTATQKMDQETKFNQMKEMLNENYRTKVRELEDKYEANHLQLQQERRNMQIAQKQIAETMKVMAKQKEDLEKYRQAYDQKLADFLAQKEKLDSSLNDAREQANQFAQIEGDYKKRVDILRQTIEVQRQRYETQINQLTEKLRTSIQNRNQVINSLEKCNASRDGMVAKVNLLSEENTRLKDMYLQMKSKADLTRSQYEAHMEKLRADSAQMQTDIRICAQKLQDATLVHDHVKQMKAEAEQLRFKLEEQIQVAKGSEQALKRLLQDRELEKQQVFRLQAALKDCSLQKSQTEVGLQNTNTELRDMKRMHNQLTGDVRGMAQDYQRALEEREADMTRQVLQQEVREQTLQQQLAETQARNKERASKISQLEKQKQMIADSLANTEYERARQIQLLVDAQRLDPTVDPVTGKSNLVQMS